MAPEILESIFHHSDMSLIQSRALVHLGQNLSANVTGRDILKKVLIDPMFDDSLKLLANVHSDLLRCRWVDEHAFTNELKDICKTSLDDLAWDRY